LNFGDLFQIASLDRPREPIKNLQISKEKFALENSVETDYSHSSALKNVHKSLLRWSNSKNPQILPPLTHKTDEHHFSKIVQDSSSLSAGHDPIVRVLHNSRQGFDPHLASKITCYEDLKTNKEYEEREIIYGKIKTQGRVCNVKIEIITFCMKKYIIFRAHK
jgi:hypothetical protein